MKILIVEDSRTMRNIQRGILAQMGYDDVEEACDGLDAFSRLAEIDPDLILVDWNMPEMDGVTFVRRARASGVQVPIIMVTTESQRERVVEAIEAGVSNYIVKPFTPDVLNQRVRETLERVRVAA